MNEELQQEPDLMKYTMGNAAPTNSMIEIEDRISELRLQALLGEDTYKEKMEKIYKLLNFYKKENVEIKFRSKNNPSIEIRGTVIKLSNPLASKIFNKSKNFTIIKDGDKDPLYIFLEDIDYSSITPIHIEPKPIYLKAER